MSVPFTRHRRLRQSAAIRSMVRETVLNSADFIQPIYVTFGTGVKQEISSMPGVYRFSLDRLEEELKEISELGIPAVLLFGIPETKDSVGTSAFVDDGIVQEATRLIKSRYPNCWLWLILVCVNLRTMDTAVWCTCMSMMVRYAVKY